jgi:hypothetical protein
MDYSNLDDGKEMAKVRLILIRTIPENPQEFCKLFCKKCRKLNSLKDGNEFCCETQG